MKLTYDFFTAFLLCSYATGWVIIGHTANKTGKVDLCQFVRSFLFAPFLFVFGVIVSTLAITIIVPNILYILEFVTLLVVTCTVLGVAGYFVVTPAVKKAYGVAKPFSDKICIVLYDHRR